jgi:hypothetical protein
MRIGEDGVAINTSEYVCCRRSAQRTLQHLSHAETPKLHQIIGSLTQS